MSHRRSIAKLAFLAVAALAVFLPVYLLGLAPVGGDSGDAGPVRIESVRINRLPQASSARIEVEVELKNHDQVAHEIESWWLLARPSAKRPWGLYAFHSSIQGPRTLAAGEKVELSWQEEVTAEPGSYELSAWVHTVEGDVSHHSDGKVVASPIVRIDSGWSRFSRLATPPPSLRVSAVDLPAAALAGGLGVPTELPLIIVVNNDTKAETAADIQWFLYRRESLLPWSGKPAYTSRQLQHRVFAPESQTTIKTSEPISLWPGEYVLRVVVTEAGDEGNLASDDLFLNDTITLLESGQGNTIIKVGPASGPVEIASLAADTGGFQRGNGSVVVGLRNRSESEQDVVLWWFLSRPGSLEPWVEFDVQSKVVSAKIAPHQQTILSLSDDVSLTPGTYELSVWVHTLDGDKEERPSDGAWLNQRVEIQ
jgi:hypothetical protein